MFGATRIALEFAGGSAPGMAIGVGVLAAGAIKLAFEQGKNLLRGDPCTKPINSGPTVDFLRMMIPHSNRIFYR